MGRGVSNGGGQSSLGYLFGSDDGPKPSGAGRAPIAPPKENVPASTQQAPAGLSRNTPAQAKESVAKADGGGGSLYEKPAGCLGTNPNNYHRAEGQNAGNFITDRPSTKVHSAPGGGSSLGYLFGGN